jgi:hypothetical protein
VTDLLSAYNEAQSALAALAAVSKAAKKPALWHTASVATADLSEAFAFDMEDAE